MPACLHEPGQVAEPPRSASLLWSNRGLRPAALKLRPPLPREPVSLHCPHPLLQAPPSPTRESTATLGTLAHSLMPGSLLAWPDVLAAGLWCVDLTCASIVSQETTNPAGPGSFLARTLSPNPASWGACTAGDHAPGTCPGAAVGSEPGTRPSSSYLWFSVPQQGHAGGSGPWSGP